ncbi:MAG: hypothetical protein GX101_01155 [Firmicutes bacterium]|nr:hypothetical protein [Bacillota bacterium]
MRGKSGLNFAVTAVTLFLIFGFIGYLGGQYAVRTLTSQFRASLASEGSPASAPVYVSPPVQSEPKESTTPAPTPPAVDRPAAADGALYKVQVGVFSEKRNADRLVELLKEDGYEAIVISEAAFHRVQTGAFSSEANAARLAEELRGKGYEAIIVR